MKLVVCHSGILKRFFFFLLVQRDMYCTFAPPLRRCHEQNFHCDGVYTEILNQAEMTNGGMLGESCVIVVGGDEVAGRAAGTAFVCWGDVRHASRGKVPLCIVMKWFG